MRAFTALIAAAIAGTTIAAAPTRADTGHAAPPIAVAPDFGLARLTMSEFAYGFGSAGQFRLKFTIALWKFSL